MPVAIVDGMICLSITSQVIKLNSLSGDKYQIFYLNMVQLNSEINRVECNVDGPDQVNIDTLPISVQDQIEICQKEELNQLVKFKNHLSPGRSLKKIPTISKPIKTTSTVGKQVVYVKKLCDTIRVKEATDGLFMIQYLDRPCGNGRVSVAYIKHKDAKAIIMRHKIRRAEWDIKLSKISVKDDELALYDVPHEGIAFVEADSNNDVGQISVDEKPTEAYERKTRTYSEWVIDSNVEVDGKGMKHITCATFRNFSFSRSCSDVLGVNYYKGCNSSAYVRETPRKAKASVLESQYHRESFNPTHIPLMNHAINKLTQKALMKRK